MVVRAGVQQPGRQRRRRSTAGSARSLGAGPHSGAPVPGPGGARRARPLLVQGLPHPPPRGVSEPLHSQVPHLPQRLDAKLAVGRCHGLPHSLRYAAPLRLQNRRAWPAQGPPLPHQDTPTRQQGPPLTPPPAPRSILGDRRGPARSLVAS